MSRNTDVLSDVQNYTLTAENAGKRDSDASCDAFISRKR